MTGPLVAFDSESHWMAVEKAPGSTSLIDVLDRVLDKGVVIDWHDRLVPVGIDLVTAAYVVVAAEARGKSQSPG